MDPKGNTHLIPPAIKNISCSHPRYAGNIVDSIGPNGTIQASFIVIITFLIISANLTVIIVINSRRYQSYLHPQPRYLLTSLALNDLAIGLLITPFGALPALLNCWPYGEIFCQIQALLRGALLQQSAVILVCMAVDRYICELHPKRYHLHSSKKGCVAVLSITWILCITFFSMLVLPKGYHFNSTGLLACEPFYSKPSYRILSSCAFYFPTTMLLMYCYGSSFHANRQRLATPSNFVSSSRANGIPLTQISEKSLETIEAHYTGSTSRTMAAISLGFIVIVTPWTILEIVTACTGSKVPSYLEFFITWLAISNSFWNPFLYWLLNAHFRRICKDFVHSRCLFGDSDSTNGDTEHESSKTERKCYNVSFECDTMTQLPLPPKPPNKSRPPDIEGLSEKYWGEILERTLSSNSLHALQRTYGRPHDTPRRHHDCVRSVGWRIVNSTTTSDVDSISTSSKVNENVATNHLGYLSNSEPRLCEHLHDFHDINCAKNKAFFGAFAKIDDDM